MKIYISGAITNNPNYKEQFKRAEERLKAEGHTVINPAENQGSTYKEYIDIGLFELMHCDAIYLLRGYERSTGATLEHDYARTVGLKVIREEEEEVREKLKEIRGYAGNFHLSYGKVLECSAPKADNCLLQYLTLAESLGARAVLEKDDIAQVKKLLTRDTARRKEA